MRAPLLAREWGIVSRATRVGLALVMLGTTFLFVAARAEDRYRLLAEPVMLRSIVLPAALVSGAAMAWLGVLREMRAGTWDGWLLLPRPRLALAASKLIVGMAASTVVVALPVAALWALLRCWGNIGGPNITLADLALRSVMTQGVLLALLTFLTVASAAQMARSAHVAFLAPLALPLFASVRFFTGDGGFSGLPVPMVEVGAVAVCVLAAGSFIVSVARWGMPLAAGELSLRSMVATPATTVAVLFVGLAGGEVAARLSEGPPMAPHRRARTYAGIDADGHIAAAHDSREVLGMYRFRDVDARDDVRPGRLWTPAYTGRSFQIFQDRERNVFAAYQNGSGAPLGCLGRGGLGDCTPFDAPPKVEHLSDGDAALITPREVLRLDEEGRTFPLLRGDVHAAVAMSTTESVSGIAVALDDGVAFVRDDGEVASTLGVLAAGERATDVVIGADFIGLDLRTAAGRERVVVREGRIVERRAFTEDAGPPATEPSARRRVLGLAAGPLFGPILERLPSAHIERERVPSPLAPALLVACATVVLAIFARRSRQRIWWVVPSLVLGPGYALACALVLWRRPRWAAMLA